MLNIVLTRIDDRLIHGQVVTAWAKITKGNYIMVIDDEVAQDEFMISILKMAAPNSFKIGVYTIEEASKILQGEDTGERVILLMKRPETVLNLINNGVEIKELKFRWNGSYCR